MSEPRKRATTDLRPGDRVRLSGGIVRTVARIEPAGYVNYRNEELLAVYYREGHTAEWSGGNSAARGSLWVLA